MKFNYLTTNLKQKFKTFLTWFSIITAYDIGVYESNSKNLDNSTSSISPNTVYDWILNIYFSLHNNFLFLLTKINLFITGISHGFGFIVYLLYFIFLCSVIILLFILYYYYKILINLFYNKFFPKTKEEEIVDEINIISNLQLLQKEYLLLTTEEKAQINDYVLATNNIFNELLTDEFLISHHKKLINIKLILSKINLDLTSDFAINFEEGYKKSILKELNKINLEINSNKELFELLKEKTKYKALVSSSSGKKLTTGDKKQKK